MTPSLVVAIVLENVCIGWIGAAGVVKGDYKAVQAFFVGGVIPRFSGGDPSRQFLGVGRPGRFDTVILSRSPSLPRGHLVRRPPCEIG